jgi:hypothetical protein
MLPHPDSRNDHDTIIPQINYCDFMINKLITKTKSYLIGESKLYTHPSLLINTIKEKVDLQLRLPSLMPPKDDSL